MDGDITWTPPTGWKPSLAETESEAGYYGIKIKCTAIVGGTAYIQLLRQYFRVYGECGIILDLKINYRHLPKESVEDIVVIKHDSSGNATSGVWWSHIPANEILEKMADYMLYPAAKREIQDIEIDTDDWTVNMVGRCPNISYNKRPSALCWNANNSRLYIGVGNEIWYIDEEGFHFLDRLDPYKGDANWQTGIAGWDYGDSVWDVEIWKMTIDDDGYLQGIAIMHPQRKTYANPEEDHANRYIWGRNTACIVFRSTTLTEITDQIQQDRAAGAGGWSLYMSGERCYRRGRWFAGDWLIVGRTILGGDGENVCLPIIQWLPDSECRWPLTLWYLYGIPANAINHITNPPLGATQMKLAIQYPKFMSWYAQSFGVNAAFGFTLGQDGVCIWDESQKAWVSLYNTAEASFGLGAFTITTQNLWYAYHGLDGWNGYCYNLFCGDGPTSDADEKFYLSEMLWKDSDNGGAFVPSINRIVTLSRAGNRVVLYDFSTDTPEAGSSLSAADDEYGTVITMVWNRTENTLHGTILARNTMEYHYYVYDIANDELWTTQTAANYTFDINRQFVRGCYNSNDGSVYWYNTDMRFQEESTFLVKATYSRPGGVGTIVITKLADLKVGDWGAGCWLTEGASGSMWGITQPNDQLFHWNSVYNARINNADFGFDTAREAIQKIVSLPGFTLKIKPEQYLWIAERFKEDGTMGLTREFIKQIGHVKEYPFQYDGIIVNWEDELGNTGSQKFGDIGFSKRTLTIDNNLIQDQHAASLLARVYWQLLNRSRRKLENNKLVFLQQLELLDAFRLILPDKFSRLEQNQWWLIEAIIFNLAKWEIEIDGIEYNYVEIVS